MASDSSLGAVACQLCGRHQSSTPRQYLNLESLCLHELPPHDDLSHHKHDSNPSLAGFLQSVLAEAYQVDFDDHTWSHHGKFPPTGKRINVSIPALKPLSQFAGDIDVPVEVDKRVKGETTSAFLGRRSYHSTRDVDFSELDKILAQDHCGQEAVYDPSIFDGNELMKWEVEDLRSAVAQLKPEWKVSGVQMSMFEMFHEMPKIMGGSLLQDRVFHVLCITAHSEYQSSGTGKDEILHHQAHTVQLPINIHSLQKVQSIIVKSHFQPASKIYHIKEQAQATERQKKHNGNSITEGIYCSLERLCQAPGGLDIPANQHRWDMMTRSDAKGSTRLAPWSTKRKETLEAIAKDVQYVLEQVRKQRQTAKGVDGGTS